MKIDIKEYTPQSKHNLVMVWINDRKEGCIECVPRHLAYVIKDAIMAITPPPIDNLFVKEGCEKFDIPTPKLSLERLEQMQAWHDDGHKLNLDGELLAEITTLTRDNAALREIVQDLIDNPNCEKTINEAKELLS